MSATFAAPLSAILRRTAAVRMEAAQPDPGRRRQCHGGDRPAPADGPAAFRPALYPSSASSGLGGCLIAGLIAAALLTLAVYAAEEIRAIADPLMWWPAVAECRRRRRLFLSAGPGVGYDVIGSLAVATRT
jgi:hypothetical protein